MRVGYEGLPSTIVADELLLVEENVGLGEWVFLQILEDDTGDW